jgi:hypothetical protein
MQQLININTGHANHNRGLQCDESALRDVRWAKELLTTPHDLKGSHFGTQKNNGDVAGRITNKIFSSYLLPSTTIGGGGGAMVDYNES